MSSFLINVDMDWVISNRNIVSFSSFFSAAIGSTDIDWMTDILRGQKGVGAIGFCGEFGGSGLSSRLYASKLLYQAEAVGTFQKHIEGNNGEFKDIWKFIFTL